MPTELLNLNEFNVLSKFGLVYQLQPKSLAGVTTNNGWTYIEPQCSNVPVSNEPGQYLAGKLRNSEFTMLTKVLTAKELRHNALLSYITHFRKLEFTSPLY